MLMGVSLLDSSFIGVLFLTPLQATANTVLFVQGAVIYAGGDSAAFNTEYSETVTEIVGFIVIPKYPSHTTIDYYPPYPLSCLGKPSAGL